MMVYSVTRCLGIDRVQGVSASGPQCRSRHGPSPPAASPPRLLLLSAVVQFYGLRPRVVCLDAGYWGAAPGAVDPHRAGRRQGRPVESQTPEEPLLPATYLDRRGVRKNRPLSSDSLAAFSSSSASRGLPRVAGQQWRRAWP